MSIEQRLSRLEKQNRLYRNLWLISGLLVIALVTWGQTRSTPELIRAQKIVVVNDRGLKVVELSSTIHGGLIRTYSHGNYAESVVIGHNIQGTAMLAIHNKGGAEIVNAGGDGVLIVKNNAGEDILFLGEDSAGDGFLDLYSKDGIYSFRARKFEHGGGIELFNNAGYIVAEATADKEGQGRVRLCGPIGEKCEILRPGP